MTVSVDARAFDNSVFVDVRELAILGVPSEQQLDAYITSNEVRGIFAASKAPATGLDRTVTIKLIR